MATAEVIDFGKFSSLSGDEGEFLDSVHDLCSTEFEGIVGSSAALRTVLDKIRVVAWTVAYLTKPFSEDELLGAITAGLKWKPGP